METRAKAKQKRATVVEELQALAGGSNGTTLKPSEIAKARRSSGQVREQAVTQKAPKRWPTVHTLREQEQEKQRLIKLAKSPANNNSVITVGTDAAASRMQSTTTVTIPIAPPLPLGDKRAVQGNNRAVQMTDSRSNDDTVSLQLRNTLRQLEELTEQNLTLKHALDFSLARQEALIQRQEEMELRSMHSQRVRSWVAESNIRLSQHDKGHRKSDLDKVSAVAKTTIVPRTSTLTKHVDNESVRTAAEHAGDSVPEKPVVQTSRSHSDYKIPKYSGDGYVDTYLTQFQLTARAAGYPRAEWGYRLCAALEGKA